MRLVFVSLVVMIALPAEALTTDPCSRWTAYDKPDEESRPSHLAGDWRNHRIGYCPLDKPLPATFVQPRPKPLRRPR